VVAALIGGVGTAGLMRGTNTWVPWPIARALLMAGLGVLAAVLVAAASRRRLRRTVAPVRLRTE
jgi:hypothetical protein